MNVLTQIRKAIVGQRAEIRARVFRSSKNQWEDYGVVSRSYRGGLIEIFRAFKRFIKGRILKIKNF